MGCLSWMQLSYVTFTHSADVEVQPPPAAGGTLVDDQRGTPPAVHFIRTPYTAFSEAFHGCRLSQQCTECSELQGDS